MDDESLQGEENLEKLPEVVRGDAIEHERASVTRAVSLNIVRCGHRVHVLERLGVHG
jgi:hypothetical protein